MKNGLLAQPDADAGNLITVVSAALRGGSIVPDGDLEEHRAAIAGERLLIFRRVYDADRMIRLRRSVLAWSKTIQGFPRGRSASQPGINFHRLDDGTAQTTIPHIFHQFGFGDLSAVPAELGNELRSIATSVLDLQNELAKTSFGIDNDGLRGKFIRHPRGGGFLAPHRHPFLPQRVSLFLNMSEPGVDYLSGGVSYRTRKTWTAPLEQFGIGDILAWRYDLVHRVLAVDPDASLTWQGDDGFWIFAMEMDEMHKASAPATA